MERRSSTPGNSRASQARSSSSSRQSLRAVSKSKPVASPPISEDSNCVKSAPKPQKEQRQQSADRSVTPRTASASPFPRCKARRIIPDPSSASADASTCGELSKQPQPLQRHRTPSRTSSTTTPLVTPRRCPSPGPKSSSAWSSAAVSETSTGSGSSSAEAAPKLKLQRQCSSDTQGTSIRVVARIRPKLRQEKGATDGVEVDVDRCSLTLSKSGKKFNVDHVFDSRQDHGSQEALFASFGREFVNHSLNGYNVCMFAYGHTGSGKTYTMLGDGSFDVIGSQSGILPRFLHELFAAHAQDQQASRRYSCEFYEVYNEKIHDLLVPAKTGERSRKVHVHPKHGVRVENLNLSVVSTAHEAMHLVEFGNQMRTVAATTMNARSSRSHAVFTFKHEQETSDGKSCQSTVTFVDLAGREDQSASNHHSTQFRESCCINTSLFHLASVITKLSQGLVGGRSLSDFRNSKLTLLLWPALIGNSRTALIATVAPLASLVDDSLSTMNFASSVKAIKTRPVINNKAPNTLVSELESEVRQLQAELAISKTGEAEKEQELLSAQALISNYQRSWEEALIKSQKSEMTRKKSLKSLGLSTQAEFTSSDIGDLAPFFTKLSDDPAMQGHVNYSLRGSAVRIGSDKRNCAIVFQGLGILPQMCEVRVAPCGDILIELLVSTKENAIPRVIVDGYPLLPSEGVRTITHGASVCLGYSHAFRLVLGTHQRVCEAGSTDACTLARSSLEKLDVTSAISEIVDEAGEQFKEILPYISHLSTRAADDVVTPFLAALHRLCPLIDEANLITKEVFGNDGLHFELHALTNVFKFNEDVPELVVCLLNKPSPLAKFRSSVQTVIHERRRGTESLATVGENETNHLLGNARHPLVHSMGLSEHMRIGGQNALLYVWSLEKFLWRLNAIRDIYQEGSEAKDQFASARCKLDASPDQNPWREIAFGEVLLLGNAETTSDTPSPCVTTELVQALQKCPMVPESWRTPVSDDSCSLSSSRRSSKSSHETSSATGTIDLFNATEQTEVRVESLSFSAEALGARVESLSAQVSQLQEALLLRRDTLLLKEVARTADSSAVTAKPAAPSFEGSQEVAKWLNQVEELRDNLNEHIQKVPQWLNQVDELNDQWNNQIDELNELDEHIQKLPPVDVCTKVSGDVPQRLNSFRADTFKEELEHHLEALRLNHESSTSTACSSRRCSKSPIDSPGDDLYCPKNIRTLSPSGTRECSSGQGSGCVTPALEQFNELAKPMDELHAHNAPLSPTVYRPRPRPSSAAVDLESMTQLTLQKFAQAAYPPEVRTGSFAPAGRGSLGPADAIRRPSTGPVPVRASLKTESHNESCSQKFLERPSVSVPAMPWKSRGTVAGTAASPASLLVLPRQAEFDAKAQAARARSPSPTRCFVGPYPKLQMVYYEVPDASMAVGGA